MTNEQAIERLELLRQKVDEETYRALIMGIKALERERQGRWILAENQENVDNENDNYQYYCSECNHADIHARNTEVPYCWYCGAKMSE